MKVSEFFERVEWTRGSYQQTNERGEVVQACLLGALSATSKDHDELEERTKAVGGGLGLKSEYYPDHRLKIIAYNDARGRTKDQVMELLRSLGM